MLREANNRRQKQTEKAAMSMDRPSALDELEHDDRDKKRLGRPPKVKREAEDLDPSPAPKKRGRKPGVKYPRKTETTQSQPTNILTTSSGKYDEWLALLEAEHERKVAALKTLFGME